MFLDLGSWADEMEDMPLPCEWARGYCVEIADLHISEAQFNFEHSCFEGTTDDVSEQLPAEQDMAVEIEQITARVPAAWALVADMVREHPA
jgi:hypothetical protein